MKSSERHQARLFGPARIAKRYMNGGHEVPISKVISRYFKSLEQAKQAITFVDRAYIYGGFY